MLPVRFHRRGKARFHVYILLTFTRSLEARIWVFNIQTTLRLILGVIYFRSKSHQPYVASVLIVPFNSHDCATLQTNGSCHVAKRVTLNYRSALYHNHIRMLDYRDRLLDVYNRSDRESAVVSAVLLDKTSCLEKKVKQFHNQKSNQFNC